MSELQEKLERDYSNSSITRIIDYYQNGTSGYVIWSNGYCEQWGRSNNRGYGATENITLLKPYKDTNYMIVGSSPYEQTGGGVGCTWAFKITDESTIRFRSGFEQSFSDKWAFWLTSGYIAI